MRVRARRCPIARERARASRSRPATSPADFATLTSATYASGIDAFVDGHAPSESGIDGELDLSNGYLAPPETSAGDFRGCHAFGCSFPVSDATTSFAARVRGYLAVPASAVDVPLHLGVFADDAVALTIAGTPVLVRAPTLGLPSWRMTVEVRFEAPGLYPFVIHHTQIAEHAALELSLLAGAFTDFERPANQSPITRLDAAGFMLVTKAQIYRTSNAVAETSCVQCPSTACAEGQQCNAAGLCEAIPVVPEAEAGAEADEVTEAEADEVTEADAEAVAEADAGAEVETRMRGRADDGCAGGAVSGWWWVAVAMRRRKDLASRAGAC